MNKFVADFSNLPSRGFETIQASFAGSLKTMAKSGYGSALAMQAMASDAQLGLMNRRPRRPKGAMGPLMVVATMCLAVPLVGLVIGVGSAVAGADKPVEILRAQ